MDSLQSFGQSGRQVIRLKQLAEERLNKLYGCQKLWFCIEEITKVKNTVIPWNTWIIPLAQCQFLVVSCLSLYNTRCWWWVPSCNLCVIIEVLLRFTVDRSLWDYDSECPVFHYSLYIESYWSYVVVGGYLTLSAWWQCLMSYSLFLYSKWAKSTK